MQYKLLVLPITTVGQLSNNGKLKYKEKVLLTISMFISWGNKTQLLDKERKLVWWGPFD